METVYYTRRADVTSSFIEEIAYNDESRELVVVFKRGSIAVYEDVPRFEFGAFLSAESLGEYYNSDIKESYRGRVAQDYVLRHASERPANPPKFFPGDRVLHYNGRVGEILREVSRSANGERRYWVAYEGGGGNNVREPSITAFDGPAIWNALKARERGERPELH